MEAKLEMSAVSKGSQTARRHVPRTSPEPGALWTCADGVARCPGSAWLLHGRPRLHVPFEDALWASASRPLSCCVWSDGTWSYLPPR